MSPSLALGVYRTALILFLAGEGAGSVPRALLVGAGYLSRSSFTLWCFQGADSGMGRENVVPTLAREARLWDEGYRRIAGLDEAGRGAWAGPVVAAAVILPPGDPGLASRMAGVRDSKMLSAARREALLEVIEHHALAWGVGAVPPAEIDKIGIVPATRAAMTLALQALSPLPDYLLIDHLSLPGVSISQRGLPKGDATVLSIAAASIVAKVSRDRMMVDLGDRFPGYGFERHKGYGTAQHQAALAALGPSAIHRLSFAPLQRLAAGSADSTA